MWSLVQKVSVLPLPPSLFLSLKMFWEHTGQRRHLQSQGEKPSPETNHTGILISDFCSLGQREISLSFEPCNLLYFTYYPHNILLCKRLNSVQQGTFPVSEDSCPALDEGETVSLHCFGDYLCCSSLGTVCLALFLRSDSSFHRTRVQK